MLSHSNEKNYILKPIFYKYTTKLLFFLMNCHFDQVSFRSYVFSIKCRFNQVLFDQMPFRSNVVPIKCGSIKCRSINCRSIKKITRGVNN